MSLYVKNTNGYHKVIGTSDKMIGSREMHYTACGVSIVKGMPTVESESDPEGACPACRSNCCATIREVKKKLQNGS